MQMLENSNTMRHVEIPSGTGEDGPNLAPFTPDFTNNPISGDTYENKKVRSVRIYEKMHLDIEKVENG